MTISLTSPAEISLTATVPTESTHGLDRSKLAPSEMLSFLKTTYAKASNTSAGDSFGWAVAVHGDLAVVGAIGEDGSNAGVNSAPNESAAAAGAAYIFRRGVNGVWTQEAYLKPSNPSAGDNFGFCVAVNGNTVAVGSIQEDTKSGVPIGQTPDWSNTGGCGAVYIFDLVNGVWAQTQFLQSDQIPHSQNFGYSVSFRGDRLIVGAVGDSVPTLSSGAAYIFERVNGVWTYLTRLKPAGLDIEDCFGYSVDIDGDVAVVCAGGDDSRTQDPLDNTGINTSGSSIYLKTGIDSGAVYIFRRASDGTWPLEKYLKANDSDDEADEAFGYSLAIRGDLLFVGAAGKNEPTGNEGCVYVFKYVAGVWTQIQKLIQSNTTSEDLAGWSIAVSDDAKTVIIGAYGEDSSSTGLTGDGTNNSSGSSGAVYVFRKREGVDEWSQVAYLKQPKNPAGDVFGYAVALHDSTLVVGARSEDSSTTGIDSTPNTSAAGAGAAYFYDLEFFEPLLTGVDCSSMSFVLGEYTRPPTLVVNALPYARTVAMGSIAISGYCHDFPTAIRWTASPSGASGTFSAGETWSGVVSIATAGIETITIQAENAGGLSNAVSLDVGFYTAGAHSWFNAQNIDGEYNDTLVDGDPISLWQNFGTSGLDMVQSNAAAQPTFIASSTMGQPVAQTDGGDSMTSAGNTIFNFLHQSPTIDIQYIKKQTNDSTNHALSNMPSSASNNGGIFSNYTPLNRMTCIIREGGVSLVDIQPAAAAVPNSIWESLEWCKKHNGSAYVVDFIRNSVTDETISTTTPASVTTCNGPLMILRSLVGQAFQLLLYQTELTPTQRAAHNVVNEWLIGGIFPRAV
jgi:hypothetical protein